ncbi:MAG: hypothetical protein HYY32_05720, partial [Chloroflexi bacterium]|nr:hypothetical protein [Chloroflexota bacterium]
DQDLYPLYRRDLVEGRLTRQEAAELLGCLWVKFAELEVAKGDMAKQAAQANTAQDVTIGGVTPDGKDATNELTYLILEVTRQLKTVQPSLYLRCHRAMPAELWKKAVEVVRDRGDGMPAFLNDESALLNLVGQHHIPLQEARDWAATGCGTTQANHASPWDTFIGLNTAKIFELTLSNGVDPRTGKRLGIATGDPKTFSSLEELYNAFKRQFEYFVDVSAKSLRLYWLVRNQSYSLPFTSALTDDCISRGMDHAAGGARYPQLQKGLCDKGHQNVADSMAAIKKLVFEEKKISMPDLLEAMSANFEGREAMRQMLLSAPKYGNDDDYVDEIFGEVSLWTQRRMVEEMNVLGTNTSTGRGGVTQHLYYGKTVGALPDGRKAWEPLADGSLSPMRGMDVNGPTAVIKSATKVNHTEVGRNSLFNMKISASSMQGEEGLQKLIALIKTHFNRGGHHIQFNLMGQDVLLEAKKHPEQHKDLLVRVAGYSAYFVDLSPEVQDDIIARAEQCF